MVIESMPLDLWLTILPVVGIFSAIAGIFGSTQEARAAKEAIRILNEAR